jgi:transposase
MCLVRDYPTVSGKESNLSFRNRNFGCVDAASTANTLVGVLVPSPAKRGPVFFNILRTGCQWNAVPREYGSGKSLHRYFQRWTRAGVFKKLWKSGLEEYAEVQGIDGKWQAADGAITKPPLGGQARGQILPIEASVGRSEVCWLRRRADSARSRTGPAP